MNSLHEFDIIKHFFTRKISNSKRFPLGIGDDAALISAPAGHDIATSIDTLVSGVHFPEHTLPYDIGYKALAVSLSDLAAMGAEPAAVLLALTLPLADNAWLTAFSEGFFHLAEQYQVELIGGNMTKGPLSVSTVTYGWTPIGKAMLRSGAQIDDEIFVTGTVGDAGLALQQLMQNQVPLNKELHQRFYRPEPRIRAGLALREFATAAIDISDGLAADLSKLLIASQVGGEIHANLTPLSPNLVDNCSAEQALKLALTSGEDYELCFTAPAGSQEKVKQIFANLDCQAHYLGVITQTPGLKIWGAQGKLMDLPTDGYQHF